MKPHLLAPLLLAALTSAPAQAWSDQGHELIAKLTYDQLTPTSQLWVNSLLTGGDYSESFVSGATWAKRASDSPFFQHLYRYEQVLGKECLSNCLITRTSNAITTLQAVKSNASGVSPSYQEQQQALMTLIYYGAELHQPLNAGLEHNNYGKELKEISYQGTTNNLYDWWNAQFVHDNERSIPATTPPVAAGTAAPLSRWLQESRSIALNTAYGPRPRTNLSSEYVATARSTVKQQVTKASERLAQIINQLPATRIPPEELITHSAPQ